jgi:hypothetical protein
MVGGLAETWSYAPVERIGRVWLRLKRRSGLEGEGLTANLSHRLFLFVGVAAVAVIVDLVARAGLAARGAHHLFHAWLLFVAIVAAAGVMRSSRAAVLAGLVAGGTIALAVDDRMQQLGGHLWSVGFVLAFAGSIGMELMLLTTVVRAIPAIHARRRTQ